MHSAAQKIRHLAPDQIDPQMQHAQHQIARLQQDLADTLEHLSALNERSDIINAMYGSLANKVIDLQQQNAGLNHTVATLREQIALISENTLGRTPAPDILNFLKNQAG